MQDLTDDPYWYVRRNIERGPIAFRESEAHIDRAGGATASFHPLPALAGTDARRGLDVALLLAGRAASGVLRALAAETCWCVARKTEGGPTAAGGSETPMEWGLGGTGPVFRVLQQLVEAAGRENTDRRSLQ